LSQTLIGKWLEWILVNYQHFVIINSRKEFRQKSRLQAFCQRAGLNLPLT
jgi:hypothetical protein